MRLIKLMWWKLMVWYNQHHLYDIERSYVQSGKCDREELWEYAALYSATKRQMRDAQFKVFHYSQKGE